MKIFGDLLKRVDHNSRGEFDSFALEWALPQNRGIVAHRLDVVTLTTMPSSASAFN
jgi:hypothetical protein